MHRFAWLVSTLLLAACGGSSGSVNSGGGGTAPPPPTDLFAVSGTVTYDFVPHAPDGGLDFDMTLRTPAAGVTVQAVAADTGAVLADASADASGRYALQVPEGRSMRIRALAQRVRVAPAGGPGWDTRVRDNTTLGRPVYAMESTPFTPAAAGTVRNLHANSGWTGSAYTLPRLAAPFALLDGVRLAEEKLLALRPQTVFPSLNLLWSPLNTPSATFRPTLGEVVTTFFDTGTGNTIYVLGDADVDTDEYDLHVVIHEWGHYYEAKFGRVDSPGGAHLLTARLDPRVAFAEGWANAWAGMVLDEPLYADTGRPAVQSDTVTFDLERNQAELEGWYSQLTVSGLLWDIYDAAADGFDQLAAGFGPIDAVLQGPQRATPALTTVFSFLSYFKAAQPALETIIDQMAAARGLTMLGQDIWGSAEFNNGGLAEALPVYLALTIDGPAARACTTAGPTRLDVFNRLGTRRLLRVDVPGPGRYRFESQGPAGSVPELVHWDRGVATRATVLSAALRSLELDLSGGEQVIEVYDARNLSSPPVGDVCFDVRARRVQ